MSASLVQEGRNQLRGIIGALLVVGVTFRYTMETWWLGWTLSFATLLAYASVGLVLILSVDRSVGSRKEQEGDRSSRPSIRGAAVDLSQIVLQSFVASYVMLFLLGLVDAAASPTIIVRLGLIERLRERLSPLIPELGDACR